MDLYLDWPLILEFTKTLIWPVIVILGIFLFRKQLQTLVSNIGAAVNRVTELKAPGTSLKLSAEVDMISDKVNQFVKPEAAAGELPQGTSPQSDSVDARVEGIIMAAWSSIDATVAGLYQRFYTGSTGPISRNFKHQIMYLAEQGFIPAEIAESAVSARRVRDRLIHGDVALSTVDHYVRTLKEIESFIVLTNAGAL